jgi:uncharacterized membrane protein
MEKETIRKVFLGIFTISIVIFTLLLSFKLVLFFGSYDEKQEEALDFLSSSGEGNALWTDSERSHMEDVKKIFFFGDVLFYILLLMVTLSFTYCRKDKMILNKMLKFSGYGIIGMMGIVFLLSILSFEMLFEWFHLLLFPQGNWTFPADSELIKTFPQEFFSWFWMKVMGLWSLEGIIFIVVSRYLKDDNQNKRD